VKKILVHVVSFDFLCIAIQKNRTLVFSAFVALIVPDRIGHARTGSEVYTAIEFWHSWGKIEKY